jgi:ribosomal protein S4
MSIKLKTKDLHHIFSYIKDSQFFFSRNKKLKQNKPPTSLFPLVRRSSLPNKSYSAKMLQRVAKVKNKKLSPGGFTQKLQSRRLFSFFYGTLSKKYNLSILNKAKKYKGKVGVHFLALLEKRLDIVIYRMFLFDTLRNARQFILHQGILVNNKMTQISSYQVQPGDIIQVNNSKQFFKRHPFFQRNFEKKSNQDSFQDFKISSTNLVPSNLFFKFPHLEVNFKILTGVFLFSPQQIYSPLKLKIRNFIYS